MSALLSDLTRDEGYRANPYKDTLGIWTLGIGRNLEANPLTGDEWRMLLEAGDIAVSLSLTGAQKLLKSAAEQARIQCATTFTWWPSLDEPRQDVIANLCFNMGMKRLLGFRNMLAAMAVGDYGIAADELLDSKYATQVGARAQRLAFTLRTGERS